MKTKKHRTRKHRTKKHDITKHKNKKKILKQKGGDLNITHPMLLPPNRSFTDDLLFFDGNNNSINTANLRFRNYYHRYSPLTRRFIDIIQLRQRERGRQLTPAARTRMLENVILELFRDGFHFDIRLNDLNLENITPLGYLTNLLSVNLNNNQISDTTPLIDCKYLIFVNLNHNQISDIGPLSQLSQLKTLYLNHNQISDILLLTSLTHLETLTLSHNEITDVSPLRRLDKLKTVSLSYNKIEDLSPIFSLIVSLEQSTFEHNNLNEESLDFINISPQEQEDYIRNRSYYYEDPDEPDAEQIWQIRNNRLLELQQTIQQAKDFEIDVNVADVSIKAFDFISLEETPISELLNDSDNIVFQSDTPPFNASVVSIQQIQDLVFNPRYLNQTKYQCHNLSEGLAFTNEDIVIPSLNEITLERDEYKFINSRSIGMPGGLFLRSQLKDILVNLVRNRISTKHFIYHIHNDKSIKPIIAADKIRWNYRPSNWTIYELPQWSAGLSEAHDSSDGAFNMVSADHCQTMDDNFIVTFSPAARRSKRGRKYVDYTVTSKRRKTQKAGRKKAARKKTRQRKKNGRKKKKGKKRTTRKKRRKTRKGGSRCRRCTTNQQQEYEILPPVEFSSNHPLLLKGKILTDQELFGDNTEVNEIFRKYYHYYSNRAILLARRGFNEGSIVNILEMWDNTKRELIMYDKNISDITPLGYLTNLQYLHLNQNRISNISPLSNLPYLIKLNLGWNQIVDISPLRSLTNLQELYLQENQLVDISPLAELTNLDELDLWGNQIVDITPLSGLTKLIVLRIYHNQIVDITPLSGLTNLVVLRAGENNIVDVSPLEGLVKLKELELYQNNIVDITPLATLIRLMELSISDNNIVDLTNIFHLFYEDGPGGQQYVNPFIDSFYYENNPLNEESVLEIEHIEEELEAARDRGESWA